MKGFDVGDRGDGGRREKGESNAGAGMDSPFGRRRCEEVTNTTWQNLGKRVHLGADGRTHLFPTKFDERSPIYGPA